MMTDEKAHGVDKNSPLALNVETVKDLSGGTQGAAYAQKMCSHTTGPAVRPKPCSHTTGPAVVVAQK